MAKHPLRDCPFSMALGASVTSRQCAVGFVARFDILGLVWRYDRVRVGLVRHVDSLDLISTNVKCVSGICRFKIVVMHGSGVASGVVIRRADCVPESRNTHNETRGDPQHIPFDHVTEEGLSARLIIVIETWCIQPVYHIHVASNRFSVMGLAKRAFILSSCSALARCHFSVWPCN